MDMNVEASPALATALVVLLLAPALSSVPVAAQPAEREFPFQPPDPPSALDAVVRGMLEQANRTLNATQETVGQDPALLDAAQELRSAAIFYNSGDLHLALDRLSRFSPLIHKALWEHETRENADQDSAYFSRSEEQFDDVVNQVEILQDRLVNIEQAGMDADMFDNLLLAGHLLTQAQTFLFQYQDFAQGWSEGKRQEQVRQGLVAWSTGAGVFADAAEKLIERVLSEAPSSPRGPQLTNETTEELALTWLPDVRDHTRSFDRNVPKILTEHGEQHRFLALLGAMVLWIGQQPDAVGQHRVQSDEGLSAQEAFKTLDDALFLNDTLSALEEADAPSATVRFMLRAALQQWATVEARIDDPNATASDRQLALQSSNGLGQVARARLAANLMLSVHDASPLEPLLWFPGDNVHEEEMVQENPPDQQNTSAPWMPLVLGALVLAALAGALVTWRRRGT